LEVTEWLRIAPLVAFALLCYAMAGLPGVTWGFVVSTIAVNHATSMRKTTVAATALTTTTSGRMRARRFRDPPFPGAVCTIPRVRSHRWPRPVEEYLGTLGSTERTMID
jgi:hypothetical protein